MRPECHSCPVSRLLVECSTLLKDLLFLSKFNRFFIEYKRETFKSCYTLVIFTVKYMGEMEHFTVGNNVDIR